MEKRGLHIAAITPPRLMCSWFGCLHEATDYLWDGEEKLAQYCPEHAMKALHREQDLRAKRSQVS